MPELKKVRIASDGVSTLGSPLKLKLVFITTPKSFFSQFLLKV